MDILFVGRLQALLRLTGLAGRCRLRGTNQHEHHQDLDHRRYCVPERHVVAMLHGIVEHTARSISELVSSARSGDRSSSARATPPQARTARPRQLWAYIDGLCGRADRSTEAPSLRLMRRCRGSSAMAYDSCTSMMHTLSIRREAPALTHDTSTAWDEEGWRVWLRRRA